MGKNVSALVCVNREDVIQMLLDCDDIDYEQTTGLIDDVMHLDVVSASTPVENVTNNNTTNDYGTTINIITTDEEVRQLVEKIHTQSEYPTFPSANAVQGFRR